jgi:Fic family protein
VALARVNKATALIPDQDSLMSLFPTLEAQASSEIENIVTTTAELFEHLSADQHASPSVREALRYRIALLAGFRELDARPICTRAVPEPASRLDLPRTGPAARC